MIKQIAFALVLVVACGKKSGDQAGDKAAPAKPAVTIDAAAANALVPAALKDKIVFEKRTIKIKRGRDDVSYTLAAPKTWKQQGEMFASLKADDAGGFFSKMDINPNCGTSFKDSECKPKDWEKVADTATFAPHVTANETIVKDEKAKGRRTMISSETSNTKITRVSVAWWNDGDSKYHICSADLDETIKDAAPAFAKACEAVAIDGDD